MRRFPVKLFGKKNAHQKAHDKANIFAATQNVKSIVLDEFGCKLMFSPAIMPKFRTFCLTF